MEGWYEADERWQILGVKSRDEYEAQFVIQGYFHEQLAEDIRKAWTTVVYLLAHAYYHWPIYDEGMSKALRTVEMAVKLKAQALGIALEYQDKKGKSRKKVLNQLIDEICQPAHLSFIKPLLNRARRLRNINSHPSQNSYMGGTGRSTDNIKYIHNLCNTLFLDESRLQSYYHQDPAIQVKLKAMQEPYYVLAADGPNILVKGFLASRLLYTASEEYLLVCFDPVLHDPAKTYTQHIISSELPCIALRSFSFDNGGLVGWDVLKEQAVSLSVSAHSQNAQTYQAYPVAMASISKTDISLVESLIAQKAPWELVRAEYELWKREALSSAQ
ncbi:MAG: hypothetical protein AAFN10_16655 [Bacteroidota bacterium]